MRRAGPPLTRQASARQLTLSGMLGLLGLLAAHGHKKMQMKLELSVFEGDGAGKGGGGGWLRVLEFDLRSRLKCFGLKELGFRV